MDHNTEIPLSFERLYSRPDVAETVTNWMQTEWPEGADIQTTRSRLEDTPNGLPVVLVAFHNDEPIAFANLIKHLTKPDGDQFWINAVYVKPVHRGKGIAGALIERLEGIARELGLERLLALTEFPMLYQKLGWNIEKNLDSSNEAIVTKDL